MPRRELTLSRYQSVWLFAMFDLPVKTKAEKRAYVRFRNLLLDNGFSQMQYSVYTRFCAGDEAAQTYRKRIRSELPADGHVRLLSVTDRQFGKMQIFHGRKRADVEEQPTQLSLF
jgi:CRISPR-associated protein Cas2